MEQQGDGIYIQMLGDQFYIRKNSEAGIHEIFMIPMLRNRSVKMLHLLAYLLYHHGKEIDGSQLLNILYGEDYDEKAANSLRAVVFRLRKLLDQIGLPGKEYILNRKGLYSWNEAAAPLEIDAEDFGKKAIQALAMKKGEEKVKALKMAVLSFNGDFLGMFANEVWVIREALRYRRQLEKCVEELCRLLEEQERYEDIISICTRLISMIPDEKWYALQIRAYLSLNQMHSARCTYVEAVRVLAVEPERPPSEEFQEAVMLMSRREAAGSFGKQ